MKLKNSEGEYLDLALKAAESAYAPYSGYRVGCAVVTADGEAYTGANIENASYGLTCCAERVALHHAIVHGARPDDIRLVVVASYGPHFPSPCGACRQVLAELAPGAKVVMTNGKETRTATVEDLLPGAFGMGGSNGSSGR